MTDMVIRRLKADLDRLMTQCQRLQNVIAAMKTVIAYYEELASASPDGSADLSIADASFAVLQQHGEPMHYREIYERVCAAGVHVPGAEPVRNLGAHLSNDPRIVNTGRGMWGLKRWAVVP